MPIRAHFCPKCATDRFSSLALFLCIGIFCALCILYMTKRWMGPRGFPQSQSLYTQHCHQLILSIRNASENPAECYQSVILALLGQLLVVEDMLDWLRMPSLWKKVQLLHKQKNDIFPCFPKIYNFVSNLPYKQIPEAEAFSCAVSRGVSFVNATICC